MSIAPEKFTAAHEMKMQGFALSTIAVKTGVCMNTVCDLLGVDRANREREPRSDYLAKCPQLPDDIARCFRWILPLSDDQEERYQKHLRECCDAIQKYAPIRSGADGEWMRPVAITHQSRRITPGAEY